jgi:serine/threonine protein kinase
MITAVEVSMGLKAVHSIGIAHADISPDQFVRTARNTWLINDFNRARFIRADVTQEEDGGNSNATCPFYISHAPGTFRSPEEYERRPLTEKVCV